jgi:hypothetical protein
MVENLRPIIGSSIGIILILIGATSLYVYRQWSDKRGFFKENSIKSEDEFPSICLRHVQTFKNININ